MSRIQPGNGSWFESDDKRYYLEYRYLRFHDVKDYCREINMTMIHIRNWKENSFVRDLDNRNLIPLGIEFSDGRWKWSDGSDLTYTNWDDWEPRCGSFCSAMYMKLNGRWYFDQEGFGIVACEIAIDNESEAKAIKGDRDFQRQLLSSIRDIRFAVDFMKSELKKRIRSQSISGEVDHINTIPQRIVVNLANRTRINP